MVKSWNMVVFATYLILHSIPVPAFRSQSLPDTANIQQEEKLSFLLAHDEGPSRSRRLVSTVMGDKAVLQGIAPYVGSKVSPPWSSVGDPCSDAWYGISCDTGGYVTSIDLNSKALGGKMTSSRFLSFISQSRRQSTRPHSYIYI